jgi:hypothetical protein
VISTRRIVAAEQKRFRTAIRGEYKRVSTHIAGLLVVAAGGQDRPIPVIHADRVAGNAGDAVQQMFVDADGRSAFSADGITALAPYPKQLNRSLVTVTGRAVYAQRDWMKQHIPDDVYQWLARVRTRPLREIANPHLRQPHETVEEHIARLKWLRIFDPNPLAHYDAPHTWVDPQGYMLSRRIWNTSNSTRRKMDEMVEDLIRQGKSALEISRAAERFLLPGRAPLRTNKPYGTDASFDGMRLGRTEIAHAGNQAALIAAFLNPYVETVDIARSPNGDPTCKICPQHATIGINGERIREPYPVGQAFIGPFHPHCMCHVRPNVSKTPADVTAALRALMLEDIDPALIVVTPAQANQLITDLIGPVLFALFLKWLQEDEQTA